MRSWLLFGCLFFVQLASAEQLFTPRIINGHPVLNEEAQFFVALMEPFSWTEGEAGEHWNPLCGGVYLGDGVILTAAHCAKAIPQGATFAALLGNPNAMRDTAGNPYMQYEYCTTISSNGSQSCKTATDDTLSNSGEFQGFFYTGYLAYTGSDEIETEKSDATVMVHPEYSGLAKGNDLALLRVDAQSGFEGIRLPDSDRFLVGETYRVVGLGDTLADDNALTVRPSAELLAVDITARNDQDCIDTYGASQFNLGNMLCAGDPDISGAGLGEDACIGDSGGPLYDDEDVLLGIVSYGAAGECGLFPSVYSDVFSLRDWIVAGKALLTGQYSFPDVLRFVLYEDDIQVSNTWQFKNTSTGPVQPSSFDFSALIDGFYLASNNCDSATIEVGMSCYLVFQVVKSELDNLSDNSSVFRFSVAPEGGNAVQMEARLSVAFRDRETVESASNNSAGSLSGYLVLTLLIVLIAFRFTSIDMFFDYLSKCALSDGILNSINFGVRKPINRNFKE